MKANHHYPLIYKLGLIIGLFLLMLLIWLLIGEINLLKTNWLVAEYGKKWGVLASGIEGFGVNVDGVIASWQPFIICSAVIILLSTIFYILYKFNLINLNFYPILLATWTLLFMIIVSGLLYPDPSNMGGEIWKIIIRLLVVIISFPLVFYASNWLLTKIIITKPIGVKIAKEIIKQEITNAEYIKTNIKDLKPKPKKSAKKASIDIIE